MKRLFLLLTLSATCLALIAAPAEAKRFGGGSSIGKQRTVDAAPKSPAAAPAQAAPGAAPATPPAQGNRWLGPLAGLALGAGLATLFSSMGLGEGMGTLLMIILGGLVVMFLLSLFRRQQPAPQYAGAGAPLSGERVRKEDTITMPSPLVHKGVPADFPVEAFMRSAKTSFIRLQAANDRKDLDDIREYTTPEMFAEISMQIRERDNAAQKTDVLALNTELLEVVNDGDVAIASVRMSGQLSENNGAPEDFDEVWHVQKNLKDGKAVWLLAGIQQLA